MENSSILEVRYNSLYVHIVHCFEQLHIFKTVTQKGQTLQDNPGKNSPLKIICFNHPSLLRLGIKLGNTVMSDEIQLENINKYPYIKTTNKYMAT